MKLLRSIWHLLLLALAVLYVLTSCATETTRAVLTDKSGRVTDTTTTVRRADPFALKMVEIVAEVYRPTRAIIVREEKSLTGPITPEEIANRRPSK